MRLIDADKFKEEIMLIMQCWSISPALSPSEADKAKSNLRTALSTLSDMPTAYDVDKVIKRLENLRDRFNSEDFHIRGILEKSIEIVKSGGVAND